VRRAAPLLLRQQLLSERSRQGRSLSHQRRRVRALVRQGRRIECLRPISWPLCRRRQGRSLPARRHADGPVGVRPRGTKASSVNCGLMWLDDAASVLRMSLQLKALQALATVPTTSPITVPQRTSPPKTSPPLPLYTPPAAPAGATARCNDGTFSYSTHHSGTCSHHGGVDEWLDGNHSSPARSSSLRTLSWPTSTSSTCWRCWPTDASNSSTLTPSGSCSPTQTATCE
jgi:hypothetical protein